MLLLYNNLFIFICDQVSQCSQKQRQKFTSQLNLMEKCITDLSALIVTVVGKHTSDVIILASAELVGYIFLKFNLLEHWF
jgi:hypothetical protein